MGTIIWYYYGLLQFYMNLGDTPNPPAALGSPVVMMEYSASIILGAISNLVDMAIYSCSR